MFQIHEPVVSILGRGVREACAFSVKSCFHEALGLRRGLAASVGVGARARAEKTVELFWILEALT